jgi:DnaK suppressor protein
MATNVPTQSRYAKISPDGVDVLRYNLCMMSDRSDIDSKVMRSRLEERRSELLERENANKESRETVELDQTRIGRLSRMDALQGQAMAEETERRRKRELQRVEAALKRIETDDYGYCLTCGDDIPKKRLEFDPAVAVCVDCAKGD